MRSYLADEISPSDMKKIDEFLRRHGMKSPLERFYWAPLPENLLSDRQTRHAACRPHVFSIELAGDRMKMEFYVRSLENMSCTCQDYCTPEQRAYILDMADRILADLGIRT